MKEKMNIRRLVISAMAGVALAAGSTAAKAEKTITLAAFADYTGPYADIMPLLQGSRDKAVEWWNDTVGKEMGVSLKLKIYDTRYDTAQTASLWPGIKSELNPPAIFGLGGPDVAALQQRLPDDKVPSLMGTAAYGFAWKENPWILNPRATYAHEASAFLQWYAKQKGGAVKVGLVGSEASPAYVDMIKGVEAFAEKSSDIEVAGVLLTTVQPADLTSQVRRLVKKGAEVMIIQTNTSMVVAVKRALQALGRSDIPVMTSSHNGLPASGRALGDVKQMEGDFESYGMAIPSPESVDAYNFYTMLKDKYGLNVPWNVLSVQGIAQTLFTVKALEKTIKRVGADNVTGEEVRKTLMTEKITSEEMNGFYSSLSFNEGGPFPTEGMSINIGTIKDGKYAVAATGIPVPAIEKW